VTLQGKINIFWFRRDLRLDDNTGLYHALKSGLPVQPVFIFDVNILEKLQDSYDRRVDFIHRQVYAINETLGEFGSTLLVIHDSPLNAWKTLTDKFDIAAVFANLDYEPYARERDDEVKDFLGEKKIAFNLYKDQVIFEEAEVVKDNGEPYSVFTPYLKKWKSTLSPLHYGQKNISGLTNNFLKSSFVDVPSIESIGFRITDIGNHVPPPVIDREVISNYEKLRDIPSADATSRMSVHLRFGTVSIRKLLEEAIHLSEKYVSELVWREFYMMLLWHFPRVTDTAFNRQFEFLPWKNDEEEFNRWKNGTTGYPIVDAGMRQLNETGFMHNRLRMITATFLTKYLLIDWRWGEAYFAVKLNDYELASNNGGWQWAAGTGADAAPYFRFFNMDTQANRFDPEQTYIRKWIREFGTSGYPGRMIDYQFARERCLEFYRKNKRLTY
jgi:deoxyribodipyrimidine photo-lyase